MSGKELLDRVEVDHEKIERMLKVLAIKEGMKCGDSDCEGDDPCPCRPGVLRRDLLMGVLPAFYVSAHGLVCTHRFSETDTPVYCRNSSDANFLMNIITK